MTSHDLHEGLLVALKISALSLKREKKIRQKTIFSAQCGLLKKMRGHSVYTQVMSC